MNRSELIDKHIEDIKANSSEVEHYAVSQYGSDIARYYCTNQHSPEVGKRLIWDEIDKAVNKEAVYRAEQELEE